MTDVRQEYRCGRRDVIKISFRGVNDRLGARCLPLTASGATEGLPQGVRRDWLRLNGISVLLFAKRSILPSVLAPGRYYGIVIIHALASLDPAFRGLQCFYERVDPVVRVGLVVRADIDDITLHDKDGNVPVDLPQHLCLEDDAGVPRAARKGGVEDDAVTPVVLDILYEALHFRH